MNLKVALPTGDLRSHMHSLLMRAGIEPEGYEPGSRRMRTVAEATRTVFRIFRERDIPVQVALGNYHFGICGDSWVSELQVRFPLQRIVRLGSLPAPGQEVWLCAAPEAGVPPGRVPVGTELEGTRLASELPNLADLVATHLRIPRYSLLPLYGSADAYPPEDADLVVLPVKDRAEVEANGLVPLHRLFAGGVSLIANADALARRDCSPLLERLAPLLCGGGPELSLPHGQAGIRFQRQQRDRDVVRFAVPDGHAQRYTPDGLADAGLEFDGYSKDAFVRRPRSGIEGLEVKVVRPQDMPQLVAMGAVDIAITGLDWLREHRSRFPSSPAELAVDLGKNRYRIGPVVHDAFPAETTVEALPIWRGLGRPVRIASEYSALAEAFARDLHLTHTAIIPIAGASEGFVPEDADILVEGTETGSSLRANNLKMLDPFMESTNCVIVRREPVTTRVDLLNELVERLREGARAAAVR